MKKTTLILSLFALLLPALAATAQNTARQSFNPKDIKLVMVNDKSKVRWIHDTESYIEVSWLTTEKPASKFFITVQDSVLTFSDSIGLYQFDLHLDSNADIHIAVGDNGTFTYPNGKTIRNLTTSSSSLRDIANDLKGLIDELVDTYDSVSASNGDGSQYTYSNRYSKNGKRKYSVSDRTDLKFHWAFNNWGDKWYNGLMKMDGPYKLRTSFSSYQLSENYAVVMTNNIKLSVGLGYESDVYKFTDNYVQMNMTDGSLNTVAQSGLDAASAMPFTNLGDWSTRLVTRYVTMPIEFEYRDKGALGSFRIALGIVPGLCFNTSHTGLKHELEQPGRNAQKVDDVSKYINPYKLDVRLTFKRKLIGIFVQVPTMPVFTDTAEKVYPIKLGFIF